MKREIGKVIDVYIPTEHKNGMLIDPMDSSFIGFKIMLSDGVIDVVLKDNKINADIYKDDLVLIKTKIKNGKKNISVVPYVGDQDGK